MNQYLQKKLIENNSKTNMVQNRIGKTAIQLMDNRTITPIQQKLSENKILSSSSTPVQSKLITDAMPMAANNETTVEMKTAGEPTNSKSVIQLARTKSGNRRISAAKKKKRVEIKYLDNPLKKYTDIKDSVIESVNAAKSYITKVKKQLDDDEDIALINSYNYPLTEIATNARRVLAEIKALPPPKGYLRSQSVDRDQLEGELYFYKNKAHQSLIHLKKLFPMNAGGFGAKGRAHAIEVESEPKSSKKAAPFGKTLDNHFLENIDIEGKTNTENIYKKTPKVLKEKSGPLQILGTTYANNTTLDKKTTLNNLDSQLSVINTPQIKSFTDTPAGLDRGDGQYKNMNNTNAAGYAWLLDILGNQRWEWLHIRGAGLGGKTDSTNLVAGARDANTHMIPFESNIRSLGTAVKNNPTKYSRLNVVWSVTGRIAKHAYNWIRIAWTLFKKNGTKQTYGEAYFQPLHTGSNISKNEVEKLENALSDVRKGL